MIRLIPSQTARRRELTSTGAKISASSSRPAICISARSESSRIKSTTSSTVIRPITRLCSSTTGAESRSRSWNSRATSVFLLVTAMPAMSRSISSATGRPRSAVTRLLRRRPP
ncbi:hypothetical protein D9M68_915910 [compost metagenome]